MEWYTYICMNVFLSFGMLAVVVHAAAQKKQGSPYRPAESPFRLGVGLGFKLGLELSIIYAILGVLMVAILDLPNLEYFFSALLLPFTYGALFIVLVAILPAAIYGTITGVCLGILVGKLRGHVSAAASVLVGMALCVTLVVSFHYIFSIPVVFSFGPQMFTSYLFATGIPSIIYILAGGWASWYIYRNAVVEEKSL